MFAREYKDKWRFGERYKDPLTDKWRTITISAEKNTRNTRHEAQIILDKKIEEKLTKITGKLPTQDNMRLDELFDKYWEEKKDSWRISTQKTYENSYTIFLDIFGRDAKLNNITPLMLTNHFDNLIKMVLKAKKEKASKNKKSKKHKKQGVCNIHTISGLKIYYARISMLFNYAVRKQFIQSSPFEDVHIKWPKEHKLELIEQKYLEEDELKEVLSYFRKQRPIMADMFEWQYLTGMRFGEVGALYVSDIDIDKKLVRVTGTLDYASHSHKQNFSKQPMPKTDKSYRNIALSERAFEIFKSNSKGKKQKDFLFTDEDGCPVSVGNANSSLTHSRKHFDNIGKNLSTHIFRHTHVSKLAELGVPLYVIQHNVGHSKSRITEQVYLHITKNTQQALRNSLNKM
ncbi:site-specific integrase [Limosilactobacillus reuteri]|uniref:tyrosine-type recombinase/integrase n=1 Tax=Limosilactobacillus reuteri TaxID=1598 RepID=UPI001E47241C|nr:site-specific integrase [Limosilactobacillus reuteri]MCC4344063.1 site-specific integrase [Limosilactobacillus reuteri]WJK31547.1 site-specific integrase [Limosilactobacillus reuteri]